MGFCVLHAFPQTTSSTANFYLRRDILFFSEFPMNAVAQNSEQVEMRLPSTTLEKKQTTAKVMQ